MEDETDDSLSTLSGDIETEIKEMMGLFDAPAFAQPRAGARGDAPAASMSDAARHGPIARHGSGPAPTVGPRRRSGPDDWTYVFTAAIEPLWPLCEAEPPQWAPSPALDHRRSRSAPATSIAAVVRFNRRWTAFVESMNLGPANTVIDHYNRYYVLEKECVMGSARLAARFFTPIALLSPERLLLDHPLLPVPGLVDRGRLGDQCSSPIAIQEGHSMTEPNQSSETRRRDRVWLLRFLAIGAIAGLTSRSYAAEPPRDREATGPAFEVTYTTAVSAVPVSGRVYVFLGSDRSSAEPRLGPDWFRPRPFFAVDIKGWKPGEPLRIDSKAAGFPDALDGTHPGNTPIQAVLRLNPDTHRIGNGEGNAYGPVVHARSIPRSPMPSR